MPFQPPFSATCISARHAPAETPNVHIVAKTSFEIFIYQTFSIQSGSENYPAQPDAARFSRSSPDSNVISIDHPQKVSQAVGPEQVGNPMSQTPEITSKSWIMLLILGVTWGGTFLVIEIALRGLPPFWVAACRIVFAAVLTCAFWQWRGGRLFAEPLRTSQKISLWVIGLLSSALPFILLSWGQQYVTSGFAGVSMASVALMVLPLSHFLIPGERLTLRRTIGSAIGFGGVSLLIGGQAFHSSGADMELAGRLACVSAAGCYALSSVMMRRLPAVDSVGLTAVLLLIGAVVVLPAALIQEGVPPMPSSETLWAVLFLGLVPTAGANLIRVTLVRTAGPVFMSLVNYQVPMWSILLGALILNEPLPGSLIWALGLILIGLALSQFGALARLFRRA